MAMVILYVYQSYSCTRSFLTQLSDLNLPLTGVAAILVVLFLNVKTPRGSFREKMARMDWM